MHQHDLHLCWRDCICLDLPLPFLRSLKMPSGWSENFFFTTFGSICVALIAPLELAIWNSNSNNWNLQHSYCEFTMWTALTECTPSEEDGIGQAIQRYANRLNATAFTDFPQASNQAVNRAANRTTNQTAKQATIHPSWMIQPNGQTSGQSTSESTALDVSTSSPLIFFGN